VDNEEKNATEEDGREMDAEQGLVLFRGVGTGRCGSRDADVTRSTATLTTLDSHRVVGVR